MKLYTENEQYKLYQGNMLDMLEVIEPNSIDSIVTDPPYGLTSITKRFGKENSAECQYGKDGSFQRLSRGFMGKEWDGSGIEYNVETWKKCYEVLKDGGYLLAFGGSRTFHRIACAIEDAGFEIRDTIMWLYGSGFPKSMNIGLAIDKKNGVESEIVGKGKSGAKETHQNSLNLVKNPFGGEYEIKKAQNEWNGWGTCLKPSFEPIIVARKPFKGSLVDNVIENGVGGINIDECRIGEPYKYHIKENGFGANFMDDNWQPSGKEYEKEVAGRFPANTILTYDETDYEEVCGGFPITKTGSIKPHKNKANAIVNKMTSENITSSFNGDSGSASRYFMNCKFSERDEDIWKNIFVSNVEENLETIQAIKESIVQTNVDGLLCELKDHYAKCVGNQSNLCEMNIVQDIVEILNWDFKIETSQVIQDFITNYEKCIQLHNLVQFVEKWENTDTTQTTINLLKLFGYVKVVITNYIQGNLKLEQKRYLYTPKASKRDRDDGLEKNTHPTVKPTNLMQYLVRLVTPNGGTILDPFNGSGSTGKAVMYENKDRNKNYKYIGIELTEEYLPIAKARIDYVCKLKVEHPTQEQISIYDLEVSNDK